MKQYEDEIKELKDDLKEVISLGNKLTEAKLISIDESIRDFKEVNNKAHDAIMEMYKESREMIKKNRSRTNTLRTDFAQIKTQFKANQKFWSVFIIVSNVATALIVAMASG